MFPGTWIGVNLNYFFNFSHFGGKGRKKLREERTRSQESSIGKKMMNDLMTNEK
jgi:hypothetical protein